MQATLHVYCSFKGTAVLQEPTHELVTDLNFKLQMLMYLTLITFYRNTTYALQMQKEKYYFSHTHVIHLLCLVFSI